MVKKQFYNDIQQKQRKQKRKSENELNSVLLRTVGLFFFFATPHLNQHLLAVPALPNNTHKFCAATMQVSELRKSSRQSAATATEKNNIEKGKY